MLVQRGRDRYEKQMGSFFFWGEGVAFECGATERAFECAVWSGGLSWLGMTLSEGSTGMETVLLINSIWKVTFEML